MLLTDVAGNLIAAERRHSADSGVLNADAPEPSPVHTAA
jgi:hypothetical protein